MKRKEVKKILLILIVSTVLLSLFHIFRFLKTSLLPIYDQYLYKDFSVILPFIVSILNILILYLILRQILKNDSERFFVLLLFIMSPIFIFVHGTLNNIYFSLTLILLSVFLILKEKHFFSVFVFLGAFWVNQNYVFLILIILTIFLERNMVKNSFFPYISIVFLIGLFTTFNNYNTYLNLHLIITDFISDFGAQIGFGVFSLILFSIGILLSWKQKAKHRIFYFCMVSLFFMSLFDKDTLIFLNIFISLYGGFALYYIYKRKWSSENLKNYVIILIMCGLIFTSGSYIKKISDSGPFESEYISLKWLSNLAPGKVLSDYKFGHFIHSISNFDVYSDTNYYLYSDKSRINYYTKIFQSRNLEEIINFLENNNIKYIWINQEMKNSIWETEEQGILLILKNSKHFTKIYDYEVEIWEFNKHSN
ncbi:hypothetical protein HN789_03625 [archaeon]|jgi:hypothetical protein|nr:hypothetical protein [archaeon]MBT4023051.1 hypothetical protein [archaeon]MBT4272450.1 hypothetical protein [archaeon]MBT4460548.1 hypothetical protein [archaeon]MBT4857862.1 hypothetical protein [archaeon]